MVSETTLDLTDRTTLMASLPKGGIGAEIGVSSGFFSKVLLQVCEPKMLYLIDSWQHQTKPELKDDASNVVQAGHDGCYAGVVQVFGQNARVEICKGFSAEVAETFSGDYLDWAYIDADHTLAGEDARLWWPKIKPGGWLMGHDYTLAGGHITVKDDIDAFIAEYNLQLFVTRGDTDIYEKNYPSWAVNKEMVS